VFTEPSRYSNSQSVSTSGARDIPVSEYDSYQTVVNNIGYVERFTGKRAMPSHIMTPLETIALEEVMIQAYDPRHGTLEYWAIIEDGSVDNGVRDCALSDVPHINGLLAKYKYFKVSSSAHSDDPLVKGTWHAPEMFCTDCYPLCTLYNADNPDADSYHVCSQIDVEPVTLGNPIEIFRGAIPKAGLIKDQKKYMSTFVLQDYFQGHQTNSWQKRAAYAYTYRWGGVGFTLFVIIYIIEPKFFWKYSEKTGVYDFWDIHSEKEESPDDISRYRAVSDEPVPKHSMETTIEDYVNDLEGYVAQVLMDIRYEPDYKTRMDGVTGREIGPLVSDCDIGFVFQLPLKEA